MEFHLRTDLITGDYESIAGLRSIIMNERVDPDEIKEMYGILPEGSVLRVIIAEDPAGRFLGYADAFRYPTTIPGKFYVNAAVLPDCRGQGLGSALVEAVDRFTAKHEATLLVADVEDRDPAALEFAQKRGYAIRRHAYGSTLDLAHYDGRPFLGVLDQVRAGGIRFFTLADDPSDALKQQLYVLYADTFVDIPGYEAQGFMAYETWHKMVVENRGCRPDWVFIAAEGDRLAGATTLVDRGDHLYTNHTIVRREFRGRKLALALKLRSVDAALEHGATRMTTGNDSRNGPMLAVNQRLGYVPERGSYEAVRRP